MSPNPRRRYLTAMAGILAVLLALELWTQTKVAHWDGILGAITLTDDASPPCFRLRPGAKGQYDGWLRAIPATSFVVDDRGLRVGPPSAATATAAERIGIVGDSHIFGLGVDFQHTLGAQLEGRLNRKMRPSRCVTSACLQRAQVLNLGVPGYDFDGMVTRIRESAPQLNLSVLLVALGSNDLPQRVCGQHSKPARSMFRHLALGRVGLAAVYKGERRDADCTPVERDRFAAGMRAMAEATPTAQRRILLTLSPLCHDESERALHDAAKAAGFEVMTLHPLFEQLVLQPGVTSIVGDGHLNPRGNAQAADHVAGLLLR